ncbi:MAG: GntR family transcriptional regulator [Microbacteriaceae bacterium]|nr:GntR family transcriptional regulator [Microbacteriaceae bacterium]
MNMVARVSLKDQIVANLRTEILAGRLAPGEIYNAGDVAERYGASRTPVREALLELESKGLIHVSAGVGFEVVRLSPAAVRDYLEVRELLERTALRGIAGQLTHEQLDTARELASRLERLSVDGDAVEYLEVNKQFHLYLVAQYGNAKITQLLAELMDAQLLPPGHEDARTAEEHRRLLEAIEVGDVDAVGNLVAQHLDLSRRTWAAV